MRSFAVLLVLGALTLGAGGRPALAAVDAVGQAIGMNQTVVFGPFANAAGNDKLFRLAGTVDVFFAPTTVNVRFCWNPAAAAAAPTQCSQMIPLAFAAAGFAQPIDTGNHQLAGPCPLTVWVEVRPTRSIDLDATLTHTCDPGLVVPAPTPIVPQDASACQPYPFLVRSRGRVGDGGTVTGDIGANDPGGYFRLGKGTFVGDGFTVAADTVKLLTGTSVFDVLATALAETGATIRGTRGTPALPLTSPFCPIPTFTCGGPNVTVPAGSSVGPLAPGGYGDLQVNSGGTLTLAPGPFQFCSVRADKYVTIETTGAIQSIINVAGSFRLANGSTFGPVSGTPTPALNVAGTLVRVGAGASLEAFLSAPNAVMSIGRGGLLRGTFCAARSRSDKDITLECLSPSTTSTTTTSTSTSTTSTTLSPLCCDVPPGALGNAIPTCFVATPDPVLITKCALLGGTVAGGVCDPDLSQCVPAPPVPPNDFCCECPVPAPPFPHPQVCFDGVNPNAFNCQPPCVLHIGSSCGPSSETCGGSPSGAFVE